ncbi:MAG: two-component regulator propeller domain-containing protein [Blastocatellia bacterium]
MFDKSNTPAITNNRFTALYEDKDGALWAGADQGEVVSNRMATKSRLRTPPIIMGAMA